MSVVPPELTSWAMIWVCRARPLELPNIVTLAEGTMTLPEISAVPLPRRSIDWVFWRTPPLSTGAENISTPAYGLQVDGTFGSQFGFCSGAVAVRFPPPLNLISKLVGFRKNVTP